MSWARLDCFDACAIRFFDQDGQVLAERPCEASSDGNLTGTLPGEIQPEAVAAAAIELIDCFGMLVERVEFGQHIRRRPH